MHHEKKIVKGTSKKYKTVDGIEKESVSKRIDLGVNSAFNIGDEVSILSSDDFNKLTDGNADEIQVLKNISSGKDDTIAKLNESNDKLNQELQDKLDLINDVTAKLKASEKKVKELESDVSKKDNVIADSEKSIADKNAEIKELKETNGALNDTIDELKPLLLSKDDTIAELDNKLSKYDAVDVDDLKSKSDELDKSKNVIIKLQNDIILFKDIISDYKSLVDYKDNTITALKNQGFLDKYIRSKDVTDDLKEPALKNIDSAGELLKDIPSDVIDDADSGDNKQN